MTAKLTRLTYKIAIKLHLLAQSCTICSSRSMRPVRKLLHTLSYIRASNRIRTYDPNVLAVQDHTRLRPRGHWDKFRVSLDALIHIQVMVFQDVTHYTSSQPKRSRFYSNASQPRRSRFHSNASQPRRPCFHSNASHTRRPRFYSSASQPRRPRFTPLRHNPENYIFTPMRHNP
jgi:hypothetical protein